MLDKLKNILLKVSLLAFLIADSNNIKALKDTYKYFMRIY